MRLTISTMAMLALAALLLLAGCAAPGISNVNSTANQTANAAPPPLPPTATVAPTATQPNADGVPRVTVAEAHAALDDGQAIVVDVRDDAAYKSGHIKGSLAIPGGEIGDHLAQLPKGKRIITYCS